MKEYPSIERTFQEIPNAYLTAKIDGQSTRMSWARKKGWTKFGSRHRLFDHTDPDFAPVIPLFQKTLAEPLAKILHDNRVQDAIVFCEYWGAKSLAGRHEPGDTMFLTLFDAALDKKGLMDPRDFLHMFGKNNLEIAHFIGRENWTRGFVERVWNGEVEGASFEGVVGKSGGGTKRVMAKAKTRVWLEAVKAKKPNVPDEELLS